MKCKLLLFCLLVGSLQLSAQSSPQGILKGQLIDSTDHKDLSNALISVLNPVDTSLIQFYRTQKDGSFQFNPLDTGRYTIMISHPYFADIFENIQIKSGETMDMGTLHLYSKIQMLEDVVVKSGAPIRIKGDTIVFTADSFKVKEGANVEELLRKLPGITVDRDGKITAMGQTVKNVLVDGEEFFGSDPGIATKNLRADYVKDVEVYDKKSDQATFTGIDDGVKDKTINLKLKEDKKKGYFGKIEVGGGLKGKAEGDQDKFNNAIMLNSFKGKRKIAAYGIMSNTGTLNLNWDDTQKFGDGGNMEVLEGGGIMFTNEGNRSDGIPTNWNAGVHYSNKFNGDMHGLNLGYKMIKINAPSFSRTNARYFYPDSAYNINSINHGYSTSMKQNINLTYEFKIDSMNTLKLVTRGNWNGTQSTFDNQNETLTEDNTGFINKQTRNGANDITSQNASANLLWMHKFKKLYRTLSINTNFNQSQSDNNSLNFSSVDYYKNNNVAYTKTIDQNTLSKNASGSYSARVAFTEPLAKEFYMELSYAIAMNKNGNNRNVFEKDNQGLFTDKIDSLSNDFSFNNFSNTPGLNFKMSKKKFNYSFGSRIGFTQYEQINNTRNTAYDYNFTNYYPQANFSYRLKPSESLSFYYYGNSNAPTLNQLQPILDYSDPLNLFIGNPNLKPSFGHSFSLNYNSYQMLKQKSIYINTRYSFTQNQLVRTNWLQDSIRYSQTINTNGGGNFYFNGGYGFKIQKPDIRLNFGPEYSWNRGIDFSGISKAGVVKNITTNNRYGMGISFSKNKEDKYNIYIRPSVSYNETRATVNPNANFKYFSASGYVSGNLTLPKNFQLSTDGYFNMQQKYQQFAGNANYFNWNASASKKFYKNQFEAKLSVFDLLDQNKGYSFNSNSFVFSETYRTTLRRFWMASLIWNISKTGGAPAAQ